MTDPEIPDDEYERAASYAESRLDAGADPDAVIAALLWATSIYSATLNRQAVYQTAMNFLNEAEAVDAAKVRARIAKGTDKAQ